MKFLVLVYNDPQMLGEMPAPEFNAQMRDCLSKADRMKATGYLIDSQQLEDVSTAKSIRVRNGRMVTTDGPFAETKEVLGGFNLIEARDMDEALEIAKQFPWSSSGCLEVRPVRDIDGVRQRVGADAAAD
ncbi:MAG TPA: YciI family protein [Gemmatimonadaceae bacterium]